MIPNNREVPRSADYEYEYVRVSPGNSGQRKKALFPLLPREPYFHTSTFCSATNMLTKRIRNQPHRKGETCSTSSSIFFSFLTSQFWTRLEYVRILVECHCTCAHLKAVLFDGVEWVLQFFRRASQWADCGWPGRLLFYINFVSFFLAKETRLKRHRSKLEPKKITKSRKQLAAIVTQWFFSGWPREDTQP